MERKPRGFVFVVIVVAVVAVVVHEIEITNNNNKNKTTQRIFACSFSWNQIKIPQRPKSRIDCYQNQKIKWYS